MNNQSEKSSVVAPLECTHVDSHVGSKRVYLQVDAKGKAPDISRFTPWGELSLQITDQTKAYDFFTPGKKYQLVISEVNE